MKIRGLFELSIANMIVFLLGSFFYIQFDRNPLLAGALGTLIGTVLSYIVVKLSKRITNKWLNKNINPENKWTLLIFYYFFALSSAFLFYCQWEPAQINFLYVLKLFGASFLFAGPCLLFTFFVTLETRVLFIGATIVNLLCFLLLIYSFNIFFWTQVIVSVIVGMLAGIVALSEIINLRDEAEAEVERENLIKQKQIPKKKVHRPHS